MDHSKKNLIKGQGAQMDLDNRFSKNQTGEAFDDLQWEETVTVSTKFQDIFPKSILNKVESPDVPMDYSINPYQGCEHGCIYCYARPTHEYWGYGPGIDFERVILVKKNAPELFRKGLSSKKWNGKMIMLSGNTDCYQPIEKKLELTRQLLEIALEHKQAMGIITKNALITRDLDILREMAKEHLITVNISITTLREDIRRILEPRTATATRKLEAVELLSQAGIPVNVMHSPIIPSLNDDEIFSIAQAAAAHGARSLTYQIVRLNGPNEQLFADWAQCHYPDRAEKMLNQIKSMHAGKTSSSNFNERMKGLGIYAENIRQQVQLARKKFGLASDMPFINESLFRVPSDQLRLF